MSPIITRTLQDGIPRGLSLHKDAVLQHLVVIVRIVVGFLQAQESLIVVDAVGHHDGLGLGIHLKQFAGIEDTLFAVGLALLVKHERYHGERVGHGLDLLIQFEMRNTEIQWVERVIVDEQAVGDANNGVEFRRETSQRLDETGMAFHLYVKVAHDTVERTAVLVELVIFLCDLLQGVAHVESEALFLRIQHQREFVALLHHVNHLLALLLIILGKAFAVLVNLTMVGFQLIAQHSQGAVEVVAV